ncbi:hypothetical protein CSOJ01_05944 [Colletotrichum sojae]|uniref:Uncharacterized protein n=1 Tax=Colletotrichum sojae TaxID=2175907 RepID=A0A8H6JEE3_9PEZI|nr:hypothetical protein CSOJ01_05944 [Colletotrichum sojae]
MCVSPNTGLPVHRVVLPGKIGGHALRALIGDFSCHVHYTPINHGGRMDATMITGVDGPMLDALKTKISGLFAPGLMMTKMVVEAKVPKHDGIQSRMFVAYTWVFDLRDQEVMSLIRLVDTKPAADPPRDWMQPAMRNCPEARRLLQYSYWAFWMRVYLVVGKTLQTPQANFPMAQTNFPTEPQTASEAAAVPGHFTAPVHSAFGVQAGAPVTVADAVAEANRQAQRLREHRAAVLRLKRKDRRAADRKGKGVDRRLHPGLHPQGPEASAAAGSGLGHSLGPAAEANVSDPLSGSLYPDKMPREKAIADGFLVDPSIDIYGSDEGANFAAAGTPIVSGRP